MISNKKSHTMKMLQLVLALSLLNVDPDNYLQQQLHNWDTQLELRDGDGWELEMLRAVPMVEYPYANRKTMIPLIEDLVHFDSIVGSIHRPTPYNITAYLLNISHEGSNETAAMQDMQSSTLTAATGNSQGNVMSNINSPSSNAPSTSLINENEAATTASLNPITTYSENLNNTYWDVNLSLGSLFEQNIDNLDFMQDQRSVYEQNLSDLNDYAELPIVTSPYAHLMQLKDADQEAAESSFNRFNIEHMSTSSSSAFEGAVALNGSFPHPDNCGAIKIEQLDKDVDEKNWQITFSNMKETSFKTSSDVEKSAKETSIKSEMINVKTEPLDNLNDNECIKTNSNPFLHYGDFIKEENELVEVLWKQDVDLGYSLDLPHLTFNDVTTTLTDNSSNNKKNGSNDSSSGSNVNGNGVIDNDDLDKLKALEELKLNNHSGFDSNDLNDTDISQLIDDDWSSIPFTIDNETGEYIRLPLVEILNDVIQFAELANENVQQDAYNIKENSNDSAVITTATASIKRELTSTDIKQQIDDNSSLTQQISESEGDLNNNDFLTFQNIKCKDNKNNRINQDNRESIFINKENIVRDNNNNNYNNYNNNNNSIIKKDENDNDNRSDNDDYNHNITQFDDVDCLSSPLFDLDDEAKAELDGLDMMLHSTTPFSSHHHPYPHAHPHPHPHPHPHAHPHPHSHHHHHHHHRASGTASTQNYGGVNSAFHRQPTTSTGFHHASHQGRMPLSRGFSMEQRLQDIASLFNPIPSMGMSVSEMSPYHYPTHPYSYQTATAANGQHGQYSAALAPPPPPPPPPSSSSHVHSHLQHSHAAAMPHVSATTSLNDLYTNQPHYGHNLGSAVSSSMHLTNSTHDNDNISGHMGAYKMEHHDMYYSNVTSSDMNHTTDGFINSILNDEDLHLMDMNVNENFYRMVDVNNSTSNNPSALGLSNHITSANSLTMSSNNANIISVGVNGGGGTGTTDRLDASSDSAVSSMGSERISSLSDGEWGEGSDSAQDYHAGKYSSGHVNASEVASGGPYDYSYNNPGTINHNSNNNNKNNNNHNHHRQPTVAQKKHHMFGKRFVNEQSSNDNGPSLDRAHQTAAHSIKYEYESYPSINDTNLSQNIHNNDGDIHTMTPVIGKEHNLYGSGAYSLDFSMRTQRNAHDIIQHNHTYTLPQQVGWSSRPPLRDKKPSLTSNALPPSSSSSSVCGKSSHNDNNSVSGDGDDESYMTRDEKRARAMNIPIPVVDIINLPMDEFNERLSKYDLTESQLSLIRDIRRRGKNKVAAQNCRKRKLDQIISLEDEVKQVRQRKEELQQQRHHLFTERKRVSSKFSTLYRHVFQYLRDAEGNPCSPTEYTLQQDVDGSVYLLPRDTIANKNDILIDCDDIGIGVTNVNISVNTSIPVNINGSNHTTSDSFTISSQDSLQHQTTSAQVNRSQQQNSQQAALVYNHVQHQERQQQRHQQQQHAPINGITTTPVTAVSGVAYVNNDNLISHQVPHKSQKD